MPKEFITIAGEMYMLKGKRFEDDKGHELPAKYKDGVRFLPQEYIYEDGEGETISIDADHPLQK